MASNIPSNLNQQKDGQDNFQFTTHFIAVNYDSTVTDSWLPYTETAVYDRTLLYTFGYIN